MWDMSGKERVGPDELGRYLAEYGTKCEAMERAEQEYRANREKAKVWWHAREEEKRLRDEERAELSRAWEIEKQRRIDEAVKRREEEKEEEERRRKKEEKRQLE